MVQKIHQVAAIISLALMFSVFAVFASIVPVHAQNLEGSVDCGSNINLGASSGCSIQDRDNEGKAITNSTKIENVIKTIINILSAIVGAVSIIMIIIGGFKYITSSGDSNNVSSAKNTIIYALVGLIIVAFAQVIVQFVLERV
jgi:Type IV secretion system pilin